MPSASVSAANRPVAVVVNLQDGGQGLPTFYLSKSDAEFKDENGKTVGKNPQVIMLGAACDRGIDGMKQPELSINAFALEFLKKEKIFRGLVAKQMITVRTPSLEF